MQQLYSAYEANLDENCKVFLARAKNPKHFRQMWDLHISDIKVLHHISKWFLGKIKKKEIERLNVTIQHHACFHSVWLSTDTVKQDVELRRDQLKLVILTNIRGVAVIGQKRGECRKCSCDLVRFAEKLRLPERKSANKDCNCSKSWSHTFCVPNLFKDKLKARLFRVEFG